MTKKVGFGVYSDSGVTDPHPQIQGLLYKQDLSSQDPWDHTQLFDLLQQSAANRPVGYTFVLHQHKYKPSTKVNTIMSSSKCKKNKCLTVV